MSIISRVRRALVVLLEDAPAQTAPASPSASSTARPQAPTEAPPARCGNCKHFDLATGQAALHANPAMSGAAAQIPPWQMGRKVTRDAHGAPIPPDDVSKEMLSATWADLGACKRHGVGRLNIDVCPDHEAA